MSDFTKALDALVAEFKVAGWDLDANLLPGLTAHEITGFEQRIGFHLPTEMRELYLWHDGATGTFTPDQYTDVADGFFTGYRFLPLGEVVSLYEYYVERNMLTPAQLEKCLLPFHRNGGVDVYLIECSDNKARAGRIYDFMKEHDNPRAVYTSLTSMIATLRECLAKGAIKVDVDGNRHEDRNLIRPIAHQLNPGLKCWRPEKVKKPRSEMTDEERRKDMMRQRRRIARSPLETSARFIVDHRTPGQIRIFTETNRGTLTLYSVVPDSKAPPQLTSMRKQVEQWQTPIEIVDVTEGSHDSIEGDFQPIDPTRREAATYELKDQPNGKVRLFHRYSWGRKFLWEGKLDDMPPRWREEFSG